MDSPKYLPADFMTKVNETGMASTLEMILQDNQRRTIQESDLHMAQFYENVQHSYQGANPSYSNQINPYNLQSANNNLYHNSSLYSNNLETNPALYANNSNLSYGNETPLHGYIADQLTINYGTFSNDESILDYNLPDHNYKIDQGYELEITDPLNLYTPPQDIYNNNHFQANYDPFNENSNEISIEHILDLISAAIDLEVYDPGGFGSADDFEIQPNYCSMETNDLYQSPADIGSNVDASNPFQEGSLWQTAFDLSKNSTSDIDIVTEITDLIDENKKKRKRRSEIDKFDFSVARLDYFDTNEDSENYDIGLSSLSYESFSISYDPTAGFADYSAGAGFGGGFGGGGGGES